MATKKPQNSFKKTDQLLNNDLRLNPSKSEAINFFNPRSKPLQTLAESVGSILLRVHLSNFRHQSRIWVSISTPVM